MDSAMLDLKMSKGAALAVACGAVAGAAITVGIQRLRQRKEPAAGAFVLIVRLKLKPGRRVEEFFKLWTPYAAWVHSNEPNTLTYKASVNETAGGTPPDTVIIYERYSAKRDLTEVHQLSDRFLQFGRQLKASDMVEEKSGDSFYETSSGFHVR